MPSVPYEIFYKIHPSTTRAKSRERKVKLLLFHQNFFPSFRKPRTTRIFTCPTCDIGFKKFALYIEHYQNRHPDEPEPKNFKCTFCRRPFNYKETRRVHEELHKQNRIFYCEECKCSIKNQASYKVHLEAHN